MSNHHAFDELDLALVDALQTSPRAPWSRLGAALGVDATTAARRWERLSAQGLAWVTAFQSPSRRCAAYVEVNCRPDAIEPLIDRLRADPRVFSIEHVAGDVDLFLSVAANNPGELAHFLSHGLGRLDGLRWLRTRLCLRLYRAGSDWRVRALDREQRAQLGPLPASAAAAGADPDSALVRALGADGRLSYAELSAATGITEPTVRRRVQRMVRQNAITFRCDFAQQVAGWPLLTTYRLNVPAAGLDEVARTMALHPDVRLCAAVTGGCNLLVSMWSRSMEEAGGQEAHLAERVPGLIVMDRTVTLRAAKRMGRLLNADGTGAGHVPIATHEA